MCAKDTVHNDRQVHACALISVSTAGGNVRLVPTKQGMRVAAAPHRCSNKQVVTKAVLNLRTVTPATMQGQHSTLPCPPVAGVVGKQKVPGVLLVKITW